MERKTVNLSGDDLELLAPYLRRGTEHQRQLASAVGEEEVPYLSESAALRALALVGTQALQDERMAEGYHALASSYATEDDDFTAGAVDAAERAWGEERG